MVDVILKSEEILYTLHHLSNDSLMRYDDCLLNIHTYIHTFL